MSTRVGAGGALDPGSRAQCSTLSQHRTRLRLTTFALDGWCLMSNDDSIIEFTKEELWQELIRLKLDNQTLRVEAARWVERVKILETRIELAASELGYS